MDGSAFLCLWFERFGVEARSVLRDDSNDATTHDPHGGKLRNALPV
jgi:hypothetical protein